MWTLQLSPECAAQPSAALFSPRGGRRDTVTHPLQFQLVTLFRLAVILKVQFTQFKKSYCLTQWYPTMQRALGSFQSKFGDFLQLPMYNGGECSFFVCTALKSDNEERYFSVTMSLVREHFLRWGLLTKASPSVTQFRPGEGHVFMSRCLFVRFDNRHKETSLNDHLSFTVVSCSVINNPRYVTQKRKIEFHNTVLLHVRGTWKKWYDYEYDIKNQHCIPRVPSPRFSLGLSM